MIAANANESSFFQFRFPKIFGKSPVSDPSMHICVQVRKCTRYLEQHGFTQNQLTSLHHTSRKGGVVTFAGTHHYFGVNRALHAQNAEFATRIVYIANNYKQDNGRFTCLIARALREWPLMM